LYQYRDIICRIICNLSRFILGDRDGGKVRPDR